MTMFSRKQRAANAAADAARDKKTQEERREAEAQAKHAEAEWLNAEVSKRLKRYEEMEMEEEQRPHSAPVRRRTSKVDRHADITSYEAELVNRQVVNRMKMREENNRRHTVVELVEPEPEPEEPDEPEPGPDTPGAWSPKPTRAPWGTPSPSSRAKKLSSRERLAEIQHASNLEKAAVGVGPLVEKDKALASVDSGPKMLGQARAAAKLAGGVFYTYRENSELLSKSRRLAAENEELSAKLASIEALHEKFVQSIASYAVDPRDTKASPPSAAEDVRGKSPGFVRSGADLLHAMLTTLNPNYAIKVQSAAETPSAVSPSFARRAFRKGTPPAFRKALLATLGVNTISRENSQHGGQIMNAIDENTSPVTLIRPPSA